MARLIFRVYRDKKTHPPTHKQLDKKKKTYIRTFQLPQKAPVVHPRSVLYTIFIEFLGPLSNFVLLWLSFQN